MNSLFTRIFVGFWLTGLLLAAVLFGAARLVGGEALAEAERELAGAAGTAAALWQEGGAEAAARWLHNQPDGVRLLLLDAGGRPVLQHRVPRGLLHHLPASLSPGVHPAGPHRHVLVQALPGLDPPLYLLRLLHGPRLPLLPLWLRLLLAVAVSGLVSYVLAALLTRRLRRLRQAVQAVAAGDLDVRVGRPGGDEVEALARDFDRMSGHVRDLLETQRRLLRDVSHELRSPLARLRVALELAERDRGAALARIAKEADELEALTGQLLSLARLDSGQSTLERRELDLGALLAQVVTDADFEAKARGRRVVLDSAGGAVVHGDPVLLRAAVENVVRNALRHTAEGSTVEVNLEPAGSHAAIGVRDHGPGVAADQLGHMFEPFARVGEARERSDGGHGLGLAITARALRLHGGDVVASNHPDGGLVVTLRLPLQKTRSAGNFS
jgi:two-component system sensor histidine kinase CpxA